jgi:predicted short-subunit dehydrogenase-like oxidoreductase (DUF2520 family)
VLLEAEVVVVAVRDDAIGSVAETLMGSGFITGEHALVHCSGALSAAEAFASVADAVGGMAMLHPLRAISDADKTMREWAGTVFGIEGDDRGTQAAQQLAAALGGQVLNLGRGQVAAYHAGAAVASNYLVALADVAVELMGQAGVSPDDARGALLPLMAGTLENLRRRGLPEALTGPIRRGDVETISRHLEVLGTGDLARVYRVLAGRTLALARAVGDADGSDLDQIEALIDPGPKV